MYFNFVNIQYKLLIGNKFNTCAKTPVISRIQKGEIAEFLKGNTVFVEVEREREVASLDFDQ